LLKVPFFLIYWEDARKRKWKWQQWSTHNTTTQRNQCPTQQNSKIGGKFDTSVWGRFFKGEILV